MSLLPRVGLECETLKGERGQKLGEGGLGNGVTRKLYWSIPVSQLPLHSAWLLRSH